MSNDTAPARWFVVVSSGSKLLFDYLSVSLRDVAAVEVILDRRGGERRNGSITVVDERRRGERRRGGGERFPLLGYELIRRNGTPAPKSSGDG
jgi:hypothetical protein